MSAPNVQTLQNEYLMELELEHAALEPGGEPTRKSLGHLLKAAALQRQLATLVSGPAGEQHEATFKKLMDRAIQHAGKLNLIKSEAPKPAEPDPEPATPVPAASAPEDKPAKPAKPEEPEEGDPMAELEALIGLKEAKEMVKAIINQLSVNKRRIEQNLPSMPIPKHMVFAGHAGTGKTTVARLVGRIMKKEGLLSKGHLSEVHGKDLIVGYVGQTLKKTDEVCQAALGGVLFIDEAYVLGQVKFGQEEAIPELLTAMENNRDDFAVIVAGYSDDMKTFIDANEGLRSRFTHWVEFPDYTVEELHSIFVSMCERDRWTLTPEADNALWELLEERSANPDFGNARGVRNLYNQCFMALSNRVAGEGGAATDLTTITEADVIAAGRIRTGF